MLAEIIKGNQSAALHPREGARACMRVCVRVCVDGRSGGNASFQAWSPFSRTRGKAPSSSRPRFFGVGGVGTWGRKTRALGFILVLCGREDGSLDRSF